MFARLRRLLFGANRKPAQVAEPFVDETPSGPTFHWFRYEKDGLWFGECVNAPNSRYDTGGCASRAALDDVISSCEERWTAPVNVPPPELDQHERERRSQAATAAHLLSKMTDEEIAAVVRAAEITRLIASER
jgi:hypothetical protein